MAFQFTLQHSILTFDEIERTLGFQRDILHKLRTFWPSMNYQFISLPQDI